MASKKYLRDYRTEERIDAKGRVRTEAFYCGSYFTYADAQAAARLGRRLPALIAGATACTLGPLLPACGYMRVLYTIIPMIILLPSLYMLWAGLWRMKTARLPVTREHRDKTADRIVGGAAYLLVLSIAATMCGAVYLIWGGPQGWDYGCFLFDLVRVAFAVCIFRERKGAAMVEVPKEKEA